MCEFLSWIEKDGEVLYLTQAELKTKRGRALIRDLRYYANDITGHGAIHEFYGLEGGEEYECTDFSSPANFPLKIVESIKAGEFRGFGAPLILLNEKGRKTYLKLQSSAHDEYKATDRSLKVEHAKTIRTIWKELKEKELLVDDCEKLTDKAWNEYRDGRADEYSKYLKKVDRIFWDLFADPENRAVAWR